MADQPDKGRPAAGRGEGQEAAWERQLIEKVLLAGVTEQRRSRRWRIFFRVLVLVYLVALLALLAVDHLPESRLHTGGHAARVDVDGIISSETDASADNVTKALKAAFKDKGTKGVILRINSPGGSPVQSAMINEEIRRLRDKYPKIPVYAVVEDLCASGGYYVAVAADKIYVNRSSVVGSIGVLMNGFGFVDTLEKLGVERRLMTAGEHKAVLDPFSPVKEFDQVHVQSLLDKLHQQFISTVKAGRGERLKDDPELYSGLYWTGQESVDRGLADGFGDAGHVAREVIGVETIVDFSEHEDVWARLASRIGAAAGEAVGRVLGLGGVAGIR
jgi:protease-4